MAVFSFKMLKPDVRAPISPDATKKWTKIITGVSAIVIGGSILTFGVFTVVTNDEDFQKSHGVTTPNLLQKQSNGSEKSNLALPGSGTAVGTGGTTGVNAPEVTLEATPSSVKKGETATLKWSVTNNPTECSASEDWSGIKEASGTETTQALDKTQTYLYTLTCKTATGTGFSTVSVGVIEQGGSTHEAAPVVTLSANPTAVYTGDSSTLIWDVTNSPTSCKASGDWSGIKATSGPESTGQLKTAKKYTYTLTCSNSAGERFATTSVTVSDPPAGIPLVNMSSNPIGPVSPGTAVTLSWQTENSPTSCTASGDWSGAKAIGGGSQTSGNLSIVREYSFKMTCSNAAGSSNDTVTVQVIPNPPVVSLTLSPVTITTGNSATLAWSASNSPTSCTASGSWSGVKASSGSQNTEVISMPGTYYYNLSCTNAGGTGYANNIPLTVLVPSAPVVTLSSNPISVTSGSSSTLTWSVTNSPTSCTASGDWSGAKATTGGTQNTGALTSVKTYTYTLTCTNAGGSNSASTSVGVTSGGGGVVAPVVSLNIAPTSIGSGSSSTLSWSATNSPTSCIASGSWSGAKSASGSQSTGVITMAGSYTYTLLCSNSAGSNSKSVVLTVIAVPVVTLTANPSTITAGGTHTLTWSATNSPTSCTAGGSWSGVKAASGGPVTVGPINTAGSYLYSLSCTNAGGTGTANVPVTVNAAAAYCGGLTPCYGPNDLAIHNTTTDCWAYNTSGTSSSVYNITTFNSGYHRNGKPGTNLLPSATTASVLCGNKNIQTFLSGTSLTGVGSHNHQSATKQNSNTTLTSYRVGYYDATKP